MLKGGVKVCKRTLVNEVLRLLLKEFFPDPTHKGATPISVGSKAAFLFASRLSNLSDMVLHSK